MSKSQIQLYNKTKAKTELFVFHIQRKALNFFCGSINNKSFMLYLLCLELSNKKGFCRLNTKELAQTFKVTPKSICNWLKDIHNNNHITAYYNPYKHYWKVRVNTKRHYELWKKFDGEEMPNTQFSDDEINDILSVLEGKADKNSVISNEKAPNIINKANNTKKNENADTLATQGIFGIMSDLIENPLSAEAPLQQNDDLESNDKSLNENAENSKIKAQSSDEINNETNDLSQTNEPQSQELQNNPNESSESNEISDNESNDNEINSNEASNQSQNEGGKEMSEEELEELELEESSAKMKAFMERFNFGVNQTRNERNKNQKVLIVTPYRTFINDSNDKSDTENITFTLEMIEQFERSERERISYFVGQPISPIKKALRNAKARIRAKKVTAQSEINKIMQTTLNKIDFLKEVESVDSVSIWCFNYNNLKEIKAIEEKAKLLNKQVNISVIDSLNESERKIRTEQMKNGIYDQFFYMTPPKDSDIFDDFDISKPAQFAKSAESTELYETPAKAEVS